MMKKKCWDFIRLEPFTRRLSAFPQSGGFYIWAEHKPPRVYVFLYIIFIEGRGCISIAHLRNGGHKILSMGKNCSLCANAQMAHLFEL